MNTKLNSVVAVMVGAWLVGTSMTASALNTDNVTDAEMAKLPAYCPYTQTFKGGGSYTSPNTLKWEGMMGKGFWHVHHYCWALINIRRAERASVPSQAKDGLRREAHGDLMYVINNAPKDFILLPEIYTWLGRIQVSLNDPRSAERTFSKARELKPDYWPAYSFWADYLVGAGRRADALKVVIAGLQQAPDAKVLIELYRALGGKPADMPKPVAREPRETVPEPNVETVPPTSPESGLRNDQPSDDSAVAK